MSATVAARRQPSSARGSSSGAGERLLYVGAVVLGSLLIVIAALNQPFNQNELKQMKPYDATSLSEITGGTRQPPLDPLLGSLVQHLLGEGQLRQRLVPVLAGIATLVLMALLMRRLRLGPAGAFGLWVLATTPLMVRYSAYSRPYALPLFLSVLFVYAAQRWLDDRSRGWLAVVVAAAAALPLARVPEPTIFLLTSAATLAWLTRRGRFSWSQAGPLVAAALAALALVGYPMYHTLASQAENVWDPSPSGVLGRFGSGIHEIITGLLPLLASWFPWWPLTVLVLVAAVAVPDSRRRLCQWWFIWPLLAGPIVFLLAYHFLNPFPFYIRPYRSRMAMFFVPGFVLMVVALASAVATQGSWSGRVRAGLGALLAAALIGQLPATAHVLVDNEAADFEQAADVLTHDLPPDAIVLYDTASPMGRWHQPFTANQRYMGTKPYVGALSTLMKSPDEVPTRGPVFVLFLDSECAFSVVCDEPPAPWDGEVEGWRVAQHFDRFTLYEPAEPLTGRTGVIEAMEDFAASLGPDYGANETFTAAALLKLGGKPKQGRALIRRMYSAATAEVAHRIRVNADCDGLDPFRRQMTRPDVCQ